MKCAIATSLVTALVSEVVAQSPIGTAFTYQGRLTQSGALAEGGFDLRFILYNAEIGGAQVGAIVMLEDVSVSGGRFSVELDFGAGAFGDEARWLEISVRPGTETGAFTPLVPRQRLTPAPLAIHASTAGDADTLDAMDSSDFAAATDLAGKADATHTHDGADITTGTVAQALIADEMTRDTEVLALVLAGDGAGSMLDADTLDGFDSPDFAMQTDLNGKADLAHMHDGADITTGTVAQARIADEMTRDTEVFALVLAGDGAGSTLDADLFDGMESGVFATGADVAASLATKAETIHAHSGTDITLGIGYEFNPIRFEYQYYKLEFQLL
ncbi:hypothetical protein IIC65_05090 [Candidatus Sumerlaeota bacterium]|nr:hypothetical protein [Candidatus Sumerlaeota bacterium]